MRIENTKVYGLAESKIRSGYPKALQPNSDRELTGQDEKRAVKLAGVPTGTGHDNFLKGIIVQADLTAPQYVWMQWQRYHFHDIISSQSKMHNILHMDIKSQCNEWVDSRIIAILEEMIYNYNHYDPTEHIEFMPESEAKKYMFQQIISNCPMGLELTAGITTSYLQLKTIHQQRRGHKLEEWQTYCAWIESLPDAMDLICSRAIKEV